VDKDELRVRRVNLSDSCGDALQILGAYVAPDLNAVTNFYVSDKSGLAATDHLNEFCLELIQLVVVIPCGNLSDKITDVRTAAYAIAIKKIARSYLDIGVY